jgi:hypothetical protein
MNPEIKQRWVDALRSGEYHQTDGMLFQYDPGLDAPYTESFCCLGVLCELAVEDGVVERAYIYPKDRDQSVGYIATGGKPDEHTQFDILPRVVADWAGLDGDTIPTPSGYEDSLITMNDDFKLSFQKIADIIEEGF